MNKEGKQVNPSDENANSTAPEQSSTQSRNSARTKTAPKQGRGGLFAFIILLLVLLGLAAFAYYQQYLAFNAQQNQISELQKTVRGLDNHPTLVELKQRINTQDSKLEAALAQQMEQINAVRQAFQVTRNLINRDQNSWVLAEVEYLLRLAIVRLRLMHDIKGAAEALLVADKRLADLADPAMLELREILANEITSLKSLNTPDVEGAGLQLLGMSNRLHLLPPAKRPAGNNLPEQKTATEDDSFLQRTWSNIAYFVGFRRTNAPVATAALQAEIYYVEQKLRLELEYARQAALRLDKESLNRHLATIRNLIEEYYDRDHQQVITLRAELAALQEADLVPALPDISGSLRKLRELQAKYRPPSAVIATPEEGGK